MSRVFLAPCSAADSDEQLGRVTEALWKAVGFDDLLEARDLTALKLHVGEPGTKTFVRPAIAAALVRSIAATGASPFLTDTAVLYKSPRDNAVSHAQVALDHGFGHAAVGAPFIPADGLNGAEEIDITVDGKHHKRVSIAMGIMHARSMVVLTHATGHLGTGLGGALKNLGMGCSSKRAKLRQHHGQQPRIDAEACTACGTCAEWCPSEAIEVDDVAVIDGDLCIGCGECVAVCLDSAVKFDWAIGGRELQERIVEHAAAVVRRKPKKIGYVTAAMSITKDCDCLGRDQPPLVEDIGLLASWDPVAIDQAVLQLFEERAGATLESLSYPKTNGTAQLEHAVKLGLGDREVELVEVAV